MDSSQVSPYLDTEEPGFEFAAEAVQFLKDRRLRYTGDCKLPLYVADFVGG